TGGAPGFGRPAVPLFGPGCAKNIGDSARTCTGNVDENATGCPRYASPGRLLAGISLRHAAPPPRRAGRPAVRSLEVPPPHPTVAQGPSRRSQRYPLPAARGGPCVYGAAGVKTGKG